MRDEDPPLVLPEAGVVACAHSALAPSAVTDLVRTWWTLEPLGPCALVSYGLNDHFVQPTTRGRVVVRVYQHGWRTDDDVLWELALLRHLRDEGAPVATPLPTREGPLAVVVAAPEGPRQVAVFEYAEGRDAWSQWSSTPDGSHLRMAKAYGRAIAKIHAAGDSFVPPTSRAPLSLDYLIDAQLADTVSRLDLPHGAEPELREAAETVRPILESFVAKRPDHGPCHGDLHGGNASGDPDTLTLYDFDCGGDGWRSYDLAVLRWSIATSATSYDVTGQWEAAIEGYTSERHLSDDDLAATVPFAVVRQLFFFGIHARNSARSGYGWQGDSHFRWGLQFLRRWLSEGAWV